MESNLISQMYFGRLYPSEEYNKIDLCSSTFLLDAEDFYCKMANESEREMLIKGIKFLAFRIKEMEEIDNAERTWVNMASSRVLRKAFEERRRKLDLDSGKPNLARKFEDEVSNILEIRQTELVENKIKEEVRRKKEFAKLKEELIKEREFNTLLRKTVDNKPDPNVKHREPNEKMGKFNNKPDFSNVLAKIKFDKNEVTKKKVENILNQMNERELLDKSNNKDFTTFALILYRTGWVINTGTFVEWLRLISSAYNRKTPTCKPNRINDHIDVIERKFPFLNPPISK